MSSTAGKSFRTSDAVATSTSNGGRYTSSNIAANGSMVGSMNAISPGLLPTNSTAEPSPATLVDTLEQAVTVSQVINKKQTT